MAVSSALDTYNSAYTTYLSAYGTLATKYALVLSTCQAYNNALPNYLGLEAAWGLAKAEADAVLDQIANAPVNIAITAAGMAKIQAAAALKVSLDTAHTALLAAHTAFADAADDYNTYLAGTYGTALAAYNTAATALSAINLSTEDIAALRATYSPTANPSLTTFGNASAGAGLGSNVAVADPNCGCGLEDCDGCRDCGGHPVDHVVFLPLVADGVLGRPVVIKPIAA